jgi:hypothetical protein
VGRKGGLVRKAGAATVLHDSVRPEKPRELIRSFGDPDAPDNEAWRRDDWYWCVFSLEEERPPNCEDLLPIAKAYEADVERALQISEVREIESDWETCLDRALSVASLIMRTRVKSTADFTIKLAVWETSIADERQHDGDLSGAGRVDGPGAAAAPKGRQGPPELPGGVINPARPFAAAPQSYAPDGDAEATSSACSSPIESSGCLRTNSDRSAASASQVSAMFRSWSRCSPGFMRLASSRHSTPC